MFYPDRRNINHATIKQFVRDNFSQYAWKDIVLENTCGPIPPKPLVSAKPLTPMAVTPTASPSPLIAPPPTPQSLAKEPSPLTPVSAPKSLKKAITEKPANRNMTQKAKPQEEKTRAVEPKVKVNARELRSRVAISPTQLLKNYVENGVPYLDNLSEDELGAMILKANDAYTNSKPLISDAQYDILREYIEDKYPENEAIQRIGAPVNQKNKVRLPYNMPSMDKIKPDRGSLDNWTKKFGGPYVISSKLDGVSGMYSTIGEPRLYTRGDGTIGQDISHLIDLLRLPKHNNVVVRGEFIIKQKTFEQNHAAKYANPRNMVAGVINSKTIGKRLKEIRDIDFVCYEVIHPVLKPSEQKALLQQIGHNAVDYETVERISMDYLTEAFTRFKAESEYELDGIIVEDDEIHPRTASNPEHAFAFKMAIEQQMAETRVLDVEWAASQDGYLKPRVKVEPVNIGGVKIQYASGINGKFIRDNGIGPGAVIQIIRSGDVIPYIKAVLEPVEPKMPDIDYVWTDTGVDIVVADLENNSEVRARNIVGFFSDLGIDGLSTGNVTKIINAGYKSIPDIIKMSKADLLAVPGFQEKMAEKIYTGIRDKLASVKLVQLMVASNIFGRGFGLKTIKPVMDAHPDFLIADVPDETKVAWLKEAGIKKNAQSIVDAVPVFLDFLEECGLSGKLEEAGSSEKNYDVTNPLYKKSVVMTKVRDQDIIDYLKTVGATLEDTIKKGTTVALIVKSKDDVSNKTKDAEKKGVPIMTVEEFKAAYM
jgi:NAD-dependent DNA ligase